MNAYTTIHTFAFRLEHIKSLQTVHVAKFEQGRTK